MQLKYSDNNSQIKMSRSYAPISTEQFYMKIVSFWKENIRTIMNTGTIFQFKDMYDEISTRTYSVFSFSLLLWVSEWADLLQVNIFFGI